MNNLKKIMKERNIDVKRMSIDTGYSIQTIYDWITNKSDPLLYHARDVAGYLKVTDRDIWQ